MMKEKIQNLTCAISSFEEIIKTKVEAIKTAKAELKSLEKASIVIKSLKLVGVTEALKETDKIIESVKDLIYEWEHEIEANKELIKSAKTKIVKLEKMQKDYEALQLETAEQTEEAKEEITNA